MNGNKCHKITRQQSSLLATLRFLFFVLSSFLFFFTHPALQAAKIFNYPSDTQLVHHLDILANPDGEITASNITQHFDAFTPIHRYHHHTIKEFSNDYWLLFSIKNSTEWPHFLWLDINSHNISSVSVFQLIDSTTLLPLTSQNKNEHHLTSLTLPKQNLNTYLIHLKVSALVAPEINLVDPKTFHIAEEQKAYQLGFLFGGIALCLLLCIALSIAFYEWLFIFFALQLAISLVLQLIHTPLDWAFIHDVQEYNDIFYILVFTFAGLGKTYCYLQSLSLEHLTRDPFRVFIAISLLLSIILLLNFNHTSPYFWGIYALLIPVNISLLLTAYKVRQNTTALWLAGCDILFFSIMILLLFFQSTDAKTDHISEYLALSLVLTRSVIQLVFFFHHFNGLKRQTSQELFLQKLKMDERLNDKVWLEKITHDLRTPASGIIGITDILQETTLSHSNQELVDSIARSGQLLLNKVNEINSQILLKSDNKSLSLSVFELPLLIDECAFDYRPIIEDKNIELIISVHNDVPIFVYGDANRLRQALTQLIKNAIEHTAQGEIMINVLMLDKANSTLRFSVKDTGRGINQHDLLAMQKRHGLQPSSGLTITQLHLQALSSQLEITSKLGEGSEFSFSLKLPQAETELNSKTPVDHKKSLQHKRLLIIDDNRTCCRVIRQQAIGLGMQAIETYDGNEAIAMFRAKANVSEPFDAIIVDYDMPHLNGLQVAKKIFSENAEPPAIIMLTGLNSVPDKNSLDDAGIQV
ncbi:MAG: response regulator, partial [Cellvibrionales bacterium]|nr:response regulator [Cellvibrionales bacterium]